MLKNVLLVIAATCCLATSGCTALMSVYLQSHPPENTSSAEEVRAMNRNPRVEVLKETEFFKDLSRQDQDHAMRLTRILDRTIAPEGIQFYLDFRNRDVDSIRGNLSWDELIPVFQEEFVVAGFFSAKEAEMLLRLHPPF